MSSKIKILIYLVSVLVTIVIIKFSFTEKRTKSEIDKLITFLELYEK